jgi:hypothetical protein
MRTSTAIAAAVLAVAAAHGIASAHFKLVAPKVMTTQNEPYGDPQKAPPCGPSGTVSPNGELAVVPPGSMLTITIDETITHPGHYRVALAQDVASLPAAPTVTPVGNDQCGSTTIDANPTLPVLADGLFAHTASFNGVEQSVQVQLPAGMTCENCVLQVIQYMKNHGAPCFYYHCAAITISNSAPDAGVPPTGDDAGINPPVDEPSGGCCDANNAPQTSVVAMGFLAVLLLRRRRQGARS